MTEYAKTYDIRWADLDPNFHMRHTSYNDYAAQVRLNFLQDRGITLEKMRELNLGPVLFSEHTDFFKEVRAGDTIKVVLRIAAMTPDGRKWKMRHDIFRGDGQKAATIQVAGAWFDTVKRTVIAPPLAMQNMFLDLPKTEDFSDQF
jgi:acyl-CoA thioester hydrolase